jgi:hypothetical protein
VAFNTTGPLLETKFGNMYVLVAIDHYSKWCEAKAIVDHDVKIIARFLEDEVIYIFGVPKYILTDNGLKWSIDFRSVVYKLWHYTLVHCTSIAKVQWDGGKACQDSQTWTYNFVYQPWACTQDLDKHLPMIIFGYRCGVQSNTKFFLHMLLTRRTPHLKVNKFLNTLVQAYEDDEDPTTIAS